MNLSYKFTRQNYQELVQGFNLILTQISYMLCGCSFLRVGLETHGHTIYTYTFFFCCCFFSPEKIYAFSASYRKHTCRCLQ